MILLLGSRVSSRLRVQMWVPGTLAMTPRFSLLASSGTTCPPPVDTVVDGRETLYRCSPSFSAGSALLSWRTTQCNQ